MNKTVPRTALILQVHKNPEQINTFINQLISDDQADVYIHIDKKKYDELNSKIVKHKNVIILQQSIDVYWGDISQVDATILLLRKVLESKKKYDFICLNSGQDLLVKQDLKDYLLIHNNNIFMTVREFRKDKLSLIKIRWPKITRRRYNAFHPFRLLRTLIFRLYNRGINLLPNSKSFPAEYSFYKGSSWFCMPLEVARYVSEFTIDNKWYYDFFKDSLIADEMFFQTLIMNSKYKSDVVNSNLMYLKWGGTLKTKNHPLNLTIDDIDKIKDSQNFFARKFDAYCDEAIIDYFANNVTFNKSKVKETVN